VKQDEVYTDDPELHSNKKFYPQPVQHDNTEAVSPKAVPPAVADKSVDPTTLYEVDPEKIDGNVVEKKYTDKKELSNNVRVPIRSGGRKSKKVFKNKNKKRKSRKSRKTSKRSRRH
jgi:hypothetical protein